MVGCTDDAGADEALALAEHFLAPVADLLDDSTISECDQRGCGRSNAVGPITGPRGVADPEGPREHGVAPRATHPLRWADRPTSRSGGIVLIELIGLLGPGATN